IELGEIESALGTADGVKDAVVLVREDQPGEKRIVAYVTAHDGQVLDASALREHLKSRLPEYMIPSAFVSLESLPLSPNGKVDRRALPALERSQAQPDGPFAALRSPTEEIVAAIWADVLGLDAVG